MAAGTHGRVIEALEDDGIDGEREQMRDEVLGQKMTGLVGNK